MGTDSVQTRRLRREHAIDFRVISGGMPSPSEVAKIVGLPANWTVEFHRDPVGSTNIALVPDQANDAIGPTLVVYWDGAVVRLDALRWDTYTGIGAYRGVTDALIAASALIRQGTAAARVH
jgi:hypothetical protein